MVTDIMTSRRILIVEDNPANITHVVDFLSFLKHEVHVAFNGKQGVEMAIELQPDVILMDIQMPIMSGFEAISLLRKNEATATKKVIVTTARASEQDRLACLEVGADAYLSKPLSLKELARMILELTEN